MQVVAAAVTSTGRGVWVVSAEGDVVAEGDAYFHGSPVDVQHPIVAIVASPSGRGYHLVTNMGGIYSFGDVRTAAPAPLTSS